MASHHNMKRAGFKVALPLTVSAHADGSRIGAAEKISLGRYAVRAARGPLASWMTVVRSVRWALRTLFVARWAISTSRRHFSSTGTTSPRLSPAVGGSDD